MAVPMGNIAHRAWVSIKTVFRVVNNQGEISDATRRRVQSVIEELGYRPNVSARGLVSGQTLSIGAIILRITDPFFPKVVLGVDNVARQRGYSLFLCTHSARHGNLRLDAKSISQKPGWSSVQSARARIAMRSLRKVPGFVNSRRSP